MWSDLTSTLSRKIRLVFSSLPQTLRNRTVCFQTIRASRQTKLRERPRERDDGARTSEPQRCTSSRIFSRCVMKSKYKFSSFVLSLSLSLFLPQCPSRSLVGCVRQRTGPHHRKKTQRTLLPLQGLAESRRSHLLLGLTLSRGSLISRHGVFLCVCVDAPCAGWKKEKR